MRLVLVLIVGVADPMVTGAAATTVLEVEGPEAEDSEDTESRRTFSTFGDGVGFAYLKRYWRVNPLPRDMCS